MAEAKKAELLDVLEKGVSEAINSIGTIAFNFHENSTDLKTEITDELFKRISDNIENLRHLITLIGSIASGLVHLGLESAVVPTLEGSSGMFKNMVLAFEKKDWVSLSDIILYELTPLLDNIKGELQDIKSSLEGKKF